jgi:lysophospholipase
MQPTLVWRESINQPGTRSALWHWSNSYGTKLPPRAYVWIIHGFAEHATRYHELATFLTQLGFDVLALDLPGHGQSLKLGQQKNLLDMESMLHEFRDTYTWWYQKSEAANEGARQKKSFLLAHSMGALLSIKHLVNAWDKEEQVPAIEKAVLSAPPFSLRLPVPVWKSKLAQVLETSLPNLPLGNGINSEQLTRDAAIVKAHTEDPEILWYASPHFFLSLQKNSAQLLEHASQIEIPLCLMIGDADPIVDPQSVENFYNQLSTHKKLIKFPGNRHENWNELNRKQIFKEIVEWIL